MRFTGLMLELQPVFQLGSRVAKSVKLLEGSFQSVVVG